MYVYRGERYRLFKDAYDLVREHNFSDCKEKCRTITIFKKSYIFCYFMNQLNYRKNIGFMHLFTKRKKNAWKQILYVRKNNY